MIKNEKIKITAALLLVSLTNPSFSAQQNIQITDDEWSSIATQIQVQSSITITQDAYIKPSYPVAGDNLGHAVAIDGNTLVLGVPNHQGSQGGIGVSPASTGATNSGAVYVFVKVNGVWAQQEFIKASDNASGTYFGSAIAIENDTMVVGASGKSNSRGGIYVYTRLGTTWTESQIIDSQQFPANFDRFGGAVDISGDKMIVGVSGAEVLGTVNVGRADTFQLNQATSLWEYVQPLEMSAAAGSESCGYSVAIDGDFMLVGCPNESSGQMGVLPGASVFPHVGKPNSGMVEYYQWGAAGPHARLAYIKASNADDFHRFGTSVAISGDTIVVGAPDENRSSHGINGDEVSIGSSGNGAVYVLVDDGVNIIQQAYIKTSLQEFSQFGAFVSISGNQLAVGAPSDKSSSTGINSTPVNNVTNAGAAYSFSRDISSWQQDSYIKASNTDAVDRFGVSVAISNGVIVVGANNESSGYAGVNNAGEGDSSAPSSGAGYVFSSVSPLIFNDGFE